MDSEFVCNLEGYRPQYSFKVLKGGLTTEEAERIFQLTPAPPRVEKLNDHIIHAVAEKDMKHFFFFLHRYKKDSTVPFVNSKSWAVISAMTRNTFWI